MIEEYVRAYILYYIILHWSVAPACIQILIQCICLQMRTVVINKISMQFDWKTLNTTPKHPTPTIQVRSDYSRRWYTDTKYQQKQQME